MTIKGKGIDKKGRMGALEFSLLAERGEGLLTSTWTDTTRQYSEAARGRVTELAERWRRRTKNNRGRTRYNRHLVLAQLGLATAEEEEDAWWRYAYAQRMHTFQRNPVKPLRERSLRRGRGRHRK